MTRHGGPCCTAGESEKLSFKMAKNFHVWLATAANADTIAWSREQRLDRLVLHALYEWLGFIATNEMKFAGDNA